MNTPARVTEDDLHAYVDGELDDDARAAVEAWLAENPDDAARVRDWREQNSRLHGVFDAVLDEELPPGIGAALAAERPRRRSRFAMPVAAGLALFVAGGGAGWLLRGGAGESDPENLVRRAVSAHVVYVGERRHAVEVKAEEESHLVKWLSKRLKHPLKAPYLAPYGFRLVGGRLIADSGAPAAQFMYEDKSGRRVTRYTRRARDAVAQRETAFRFVAGDGVSSFYWIGGPLAFALIGDMKRAELLALAQRISTQLNP